MIELTAGKDDDGRRLDRIIRKALPDYPLSLIHRLLRQKKILVDNNPATPNHRIKQGMVIQVLAPVNRTSDQVNRDNVNHKKSMVNNQESHLQTSISEPYSIRPPLRLKPSRHSWQTGAFIGAPAQPHKSKNTANQKYPFADGILAIRSKNLLATTLGCSLCVWQGSGIIVFNKPQGLSTHGPNSLDFIVNAWLATEGALPRSLSFKPGPLHRLDKPTSGAIVFSQTLEGAKLFSALLRERKIEKTYIAIVEGRIKSEKGKVKSEKSKYGEIMWRDTLTHDKNKRKSLINLPLPTPYSLLPILKEAITTVKTLASNDSYSLIEAGIKTGRHHQIRAQAAAHGHPLAGDIKYGAKPLPGQSRGGAFFLHAWKIRFNECPDGFPQEIIAPLPEAFQAKIEALFNSQRKY